MKWVKAFNKLLLNFVKELSEVYNNAEYLVVYYNTVKLLIVNDETCCLNYFLKYVPQFSEQIKNRNEDFFLKNSTEDNMSKVNFINGIKLKELWLVSTDNTKDKIWQYFNTMLKASEMAKQEIQTCAKTE